MTPTAPTIPISAIPTVAEIRAKILADALKNMFSPKTEDKKNG